jgi:DNA-nicking Smr family endonuclease
VSKRKRDLTEDEQSLWTRVTERVKRRRAPPKASERTEADRKALGAPEPIVKRFAELPPPSRTKTASAPPANRSAEKRVRRGKLEIGATLDLHGHTQESARAALIRFLQGAQRRGDRTVIVVTGVGRAGGGVLRQRLPDWLGERELRGVTSGYAQAHQTHGGAGAYYVFLKMRAE